MQANLAHFECDLNTDTSVRDTSVMGTSAREMKEEFIPVLDEHGDFAYLADADEYHRLTFNGFGRACGTKRKVHSVRLVVSLRDVKPDRVIRGGIKFGADWNKNCVRESVGDIYRVHRHVAERCSAAAPLRPPVDGGCM